MARQVVEKSRPDAKTVALCYTSPACFAFRYIRNPFLFFFFFFANDRGLTSFGFLERS